VGGSGNSLDKNYKYSIEKDTNCIAERTNNMHVGFVNLFQRYEKLWMNGRVRSMNLRVDRALMRRDMSLIGIIDAASIVRKDCNTHGLDLNSRGKKRLMHLIAERVTGDHVLGISSIPVITHATASPILA
jgi:hypothetical protein